MTSQARGVTECDVAHAPLFSVAK